MDAQVVDLGTKAVAGFGVLLAGFVGGWSTSFWKTKEQRAELEDFKEKRRLTNAEATEDANILSMHADMFAKIKGCGGSPDEFRAFVEQFRRNERRKNVDAETVQMINIEHSVHVEKVAETAPKSEWETRIETTKDGEKLQILTNLNTGQETYSMARRDNEEVFAAEANFFEKVWYNRHRMVREKVEAGKEKVNAKDWEAALIVAKEIEDKGIVDGWPWNDFEWGMINGKLSALRWVMGDAWDFLDT